MAAKPRTNGTNTVPRRLPPSGRTLDRMIEAFGWLELIDDIACRRIVLAWAYRIKWRTIAAKAGLSKRIAQRVLDHGAATIAVELSRRGRWRLFVGLERGFTPQRFRGSN